MNYTPRSEPEGNWICRKCGTGNRQRELKCFRCRKQYEAPAEDTPEPN